MRTERTRTTLPNHLKSGELPHIPSDIHSKVSRHFQQWQSAKPRSTDLPNPWRKGRKFNNEPK